MCRTDDTGLTSPLKPFLGNVEAPPAPAALICEEAHCSRRYDVFHLIKKFMHCGNGTSQ